MAKERDEFANEHFEGQEEIVNEAIRRNTIYKAKYKLTGYNINIKFHPIAQHYWICDPTVPEMKDQPFCGYYDPMTIQEALELYPQIDLEEFLERINEINVAEWKYKTPVDSKVKYVGPFAQEIWENFELGHDPLHLDTITMDGINFVAIKALTEEIRKLIGSVERAGYTLVPLNLHYTRGRIKLEMGLAKGKKQHDKRADEKEKDWKREQQRLLRQKR